MKKLLRTIIIFSLALPVYAQQNFKLTASVLGSGGIKASNSSYALNGTIGQAAIGNSSGSSYKQLAGFWQVRLIVTDVEDESENILPTEYKLEQNYPNPFNPSTVIEYALPFNSNVSLEVYNILGQRVEELINSEQSAGYHKTNWNPKVSSGVYFYRITAASADNPPILFSQTRKLLFMK